MSSFNEISGLVLDQEKEYYDLLNIHIKSLDQKEPIEIDFQTELHSFLHANLLKPFESQQMKMKYLHVILEPRIIKMLRLCFWHILCNRFPETVDVLVQDEVQKYYKKKLSRNYVKLFQSLPQPKDDLTNYVIFTISYLIHFCFYKYFPPQREFFDFRFILNCYHTVLYELNGIFVSDIYVKLQIEKYFTNKFLDYEKKNMKELMQKQLELRKLNNKKFLGFHLDFPDITSTKDGLEFKDRILTHLKKDRTKLIIPQDDKTNAHTTTHHHTHHHGHQSEKILQRTKLYSNTVDSSGYFSINKSRLNTESDSMLSNLRLNCNQVSPTLGRLLEYEDLNLPFKKKKMIKHVFEKVDDRQNDMLNQMKQMYTEKEQSANKKKETKVSQRGKTLIDHYGLRAPPKEYYTKHQSLQKYFKEMLDINYVLTENQDQASNLPSSIEILRRYNNKLVGQMQHKLEEKMLQEKLDNQKKQIQQIDKMNMDSGNQEIFDLPFDGSRRQGRKLLQYVHSKVRKELEMEQQQKQNEDSLEIDLKKQIHMKGDVLVAPLGQSSSLPSLMPQSKVLQVSKDKYLQNFEDQLTRKITQGNISILPVLSKDVSVPSFITPKQQDINNAARQGELDSPVKNFSLRKTLLIDNILPLEKLEKSIDQHDNEHDTAENHRKIKSKVQQKEDNSKPSHHGNLPEYILNRALDPQVLYEDKRRDYKQKYKSIFEQSNVDQNINDLCHSILQKRNLISHGLKKKHH